MNMPVPIFAHSAKPHSALLRQNPQTPACIRLEWMMNKEKADITDDLIHQISNVAVVRTVNLDYM